MNMKVLDDGIEFRLQSDFFRNILLHEVLQFISTLYKQKINLTEKQIKMSDYKRLRCVDFLKRLDSNVLCSCDAYQIRAANQ